MDDPKQLEESLSGFAGRERGDPIRSLDYWERVALLALLVYSAAVFTAVIVVGLAKENDDLVSAGLIALSAACGVVLHRLGLLAKRGRGRSSRECHKCDYWR